MKKLLNSTSPEVCIVPNVVAICARSTTGRNLMYIEKETGEWLRWMEAALLGQVVGG